jgi:hypothetical protein
MVKRQMGLETLRPSIKSMAIQPYKDKSDQHAEQHGGTVNILDEQENHSDSQGKNRHNSYASRSMKSETQDANTGSQAEIGNRVPSPNGLPGESDDLAEDAARKKDDQPSWTAP